MRSHERPKKVGGWKMSSDGWGKLPGEDASAGTRSVTGREPSALDSFHAAEEELKGGLMKEAAELVDELAPKLPREKALAVVATALELEEEPKPWLALAERTGATMPLRLLHGGRAGVTGRADAERAVDAREKRAEAARAWIESAEGLPLPSASMSGRKPLLTVVAAGEEEPSWLPGGIVGLVVAAGGSGKTTWLAELAMRVAFGDPRDTAKGVPYKVARNGPVMVLLAEEDEQGVRSALRRGLERALAQGDPEPTEDEWRRRVWALGGADHATALGALVLVDDPVRGRVTEVVPSALHDALCERARTMGPLLVVLDPINQLLPSGASENDATSAAAMITLAGELRRAAEEGVRRRWAHESGYDADDYDGPRPVVLLAHHEKKGGGDGGADAARGSTAFVDNARWVCRMTVDHARDPALTRWTLVKTNYTRRREDEAVAAWDDAGLAWREVTEADRLAWAVSAGEVDARKTREGLLSALEEAGAEGMTRSQAESAHGAVTVREAESAGLVVAVKKGGGSRLYLARSAPEKVVADDLLGGES